MVVKNIKLINFRNFSEVNLSFFQTVLIIGSNAQGKSNLLEAIYFLATTKPTRVERDLQLISWGEKFAQVMGEVEDGEKLTKLEIGLKESKDDLSVLEKRVRVNGVLKRVTDYLGKLVVVYFSPEDINLIPGSPSLRRFYLDTVLSQTDRSYKKASNSYANVLVSRNKLLKKIKEGQAHYSELEYWTLELIEQGQIISQKRDHFFQFLNQQADDLNKKRGSFGKLEFVYDQSLINQDRIESYREKEILASATLVGPHRDDFSFLLDGQNLSFFGSRGQQRMAVLDLKLLELQFIEEIHQITPVLLLDDIFSELDEKRRELVTSVISDYQTIISAVDIENIPQDLLYTAQKIQISLGQIVD